MMAALNGSALGENNYGLECEIDGKYEEAAIWYEKSLKQGHFTSKKRLDLIYDNAKIFKENHKEWLNIKEYDDVNEK